MEITNKQIFVARRRKFPIYVCLQEILHHRQKQSTGKHWQKAKCFHKSTCRRWPLVLCNSKKRWRNSRAIKHWSCSICSIRWLCSRICLHLNGRSACQMPVEAIMRKSRVHRKTRTLSMMNDDVLANWTRLSLEIWR